LPAQSLLELISHYGSSARAKLANVAIVGAPEDQLRAPLEALLPGLAEVAGVPAGQIGLVGETTLAGTGTRPDFAVTRGLRAGSQALVGFIEVKAPGKGADPRRFATPHDKAQWQKLKSLPNLLYTDGGSFSLWQNGEPAGEIVHLDGDIETAGARLSASPALVTLIGDFLNWRPIPPSNARQLAHVAARLCRLLRDEVEERLQARSEALTALARDCANCCFPRRTTPASPTAMHRR
jgi:hypothetical protein